MRLRLRRAAGSWRLAGLPLLAMSICGGAAAEVRFASADALEIRIEQTLPHPPEAAWSRLLDIAGWWSDAHTYSGSAKRLHLDATPGGCWCETWPGGEVEHGRVIAVQPPSRLRFRSELGPLQNLGVSGVLTFDLTPAPDGGETRISLTYVVSGSSRSGLQTLGPAIDPVLSEQMRRLASTP